MGHVRCHILSQPISNQCTKSLCIKTNNTLSHWEGLSCMLIDLIVVYDWKVRRITWHDLTQNVVRCWCITMVTWHDLTQNVVRCWCISKEINKDAKTLIKGCCSATDLFNNNKIVRHHPFILHYLTTKDQLLISISYN
jgi:hypothetical protein